MNLSLFTRRIMRSGSRSGFVPLLIAIGIVSMLAAMSLVNSLSAGILNKKLLGRINKLEAFYTTEISAWHAYLRDVDKLTVASVGFDKSPYDNLGITEDPYTSTRGSPLNIAATRLLAPSHALIRRYDDTRTLASMPTTGEYCGKTGFSSNKTYKTCLRIPVGSATPWLIGMGGGLGGLSGSPAVLSFPIKFWGLAKDGKGASGFGTNGLVSTRISSNAQMSKISYFKNAPCNFAALCSQNNVIYFNTAEGVWRFSGADGRAMGTQAPALSAGLMIPLPNTHSEFKASPALLLQGQTPYLPYDTDTSGSAYSQIGWRALGQNGIGSLKVHTGFNEHYLDWMMTPESKLKVLAVSYDNSGNAQNSLLILQYLLDGTGEPTTRFDTSFGNGTGFVKFDFEGANATVSTARFMSDGKMRAISRVGPGDVRIYQFNADGSRDLTFGDNNSGSFKLTAGGATSYSANLLADKTFFIQTFSMKTWANNRKVGLEKHKADGSLDTSFNTTGSVVLFSDDAPVGVIIDPMTILQANDGSVIAVFQANAAYTRLIPQQVANQIGCDSGIGVAHLSANGALDSSFGNGSQNGFPGIQFICWDVTAETGVYSSWALTE